MKIARIYLRVSTDEQDLTRQNEIIENARNNGFYVAGIYKEKASGARADRPELQRMIDDLQLDEVVIAEHIDRISRLPLDSALALINSIKERGAKLAIPGIVDLTELANAQSGVAKVVLESVQDMLLKVALQLARDEYENRRKRQKEGIELAKRQGRYQGRTANLRLHKRIIEYRSRKTSIAET
ncbi:recombinase family protein, partial [Escherichia coli]|nr:recombinase family protein [Escherichia coli]